MYIHIYILSYLLPVELAVIREVEAAPLKWTPLSHHPVGRRGSPRPRPPGNKERRAAVVVVAFGCGSKIGTKWTSREWKTQLS